MSVQNIKGLSCHFTYLLYASSPVLTKKEISRREARQGRGEKGLQAAILYGLEGFGPLSTKWSWGFSPFFLIKWYDMEMGFNGPLVRSIFYSWSTMCKAGSAFPFTAYSNGNANIYFSWAKNKTFFPLTIYFHKWVLQKEKVLKSFHSIQWKLLYANISNYLAHGYFLLIRYVL